MKNDLDFIKEKIEESGVHAPEDMDAGYVLDTLADVAPKPVEVKPRHPWRWVTAAAAAFVAVAALSVAIAVMFHPQTAPRTVNGLRQFQNRDEINSVLAAIADERLKYDSGDIAVEEDAEFNAAAGEKAADGAASAGTGSGSASHSETYRQVEGVDEADIVKTDGRNIYCVQNTYERDYVSVFSADGQDSREVAQIDPINAGKATDDEAAKWDDDTWITIEEMFLSNDRLTVIVTGSAGEDYVTRAYVYDVSRADHARLLGITTQDGYYSTSRMIGDRLYIVSATVMNDARHLPVCGTGNTAEEMEPDCIYTIEKPADTELVILGSYDLALGVSMTQSTAFLGCSGEVYCNEENMFLTAYDYGYFGVSDTADYHPTTHIIKAELAQGITFTANTSVEGYLYSRYSMDERGGYLRVATTSYEDDRNVNNLFILDSELNQVGAVTGFAAGESIKAVRYVGDTAYVITYEQTDPLFVIDLSDPASPAILGSVEITGFSSMLVPVDENTILGIGYNTGEYDYTDMEVQDGLKLALFDVSDPLNPQVLDSRSYVSYDSPVMYDPRALVYNPDRGDYVIPLNYHYMDMDVWEDEGYDDESAYDYHGGMLNFAVRGGKIVEIDQYEADYEEDVRRCVYVGDTVYMMHYDNEYALALDSVSYR